MLAKSGYATHAHITMYYAPTNTGLQAYERYIRQTPIGTRARQEIVTAFVIETGKKTKKYPMLSLAVCVSGLEKTARKNLHEKTFKDLLANGLAAAADNKGWLRKLSCAEMLAIQYLAERPATIEEIFTGTNEIYAPRNVGAQYIWINSPEDRPRKKSFSTITAALESLCAGEILEKQLTNEGRVAYRLNKQKFIEPLYFTNNALWRKTVTSGS